MKSYKTIDSFIISLKILSLLVFTSIFLYWSINAIIKFNSSPTTSTVSYKFGDDGHGNFDFPAITICLGTFNWITLSPQMIANCSRITFYSLATGKMLYADINSFYIALIQCTADKNHFPITTTPFLSNKEQVIYPFKTIKEFLDVSKMLEIHEILESFMFAKGHDKNITVDQWDEERIKLMNKYWKPTLHYEKGLCYTFDPKIYGTFQANPENLLSLDLSFDFQKTREKLKPYSGCTREICNVEYKVLIHSSKESLNNDLHSSNPIVTVKYKKKTKALITKIKLHSISTEENYCAPDDILIRCACQLKKADEMIMTKFNCRLPWTINDRYNFCPIIDKKQNQTYADIVTTWHDDFLHHEKNCPKMPKCERFIYKMDLFPNDGDDSSSLTIKLTDPNILTILDGYSYDLQSFIGEVGGTLGLFLGLSMFSIIEFIEYVLRKLSSTNVF